MSGRVTARLAAALLLAAGTAGAATAGAQEVVLEGAADAAVDRRLARLLQADPLVVSRDTLLAAGDTVPRSVLVLDATLVHEGVILGDLVLVDASGFIRPRSVVTGDLVNIAGGLYRSEIARVGGRILDLPVAPYEVLRERERLVILATDRPSPLILHGLLGFHAPTYDRVNGLTLAWGAGYRLPLLAGLRPEAHAHIGWHTQRGDPAYGASLRLHRSTTNLSAGYERGWETNERWIREDLINSLVYLWNGDDLRDYHEVSRAWIGAGRDIGTGSQRLSIRLDLRGQLEDASTLRAGQPWFLWGSETRPNLPIDDGRITSMVAGADIGWEGRRTLLTARAEIEAAGQVLDGGLGFSRVTGRGAWAMAALANHSLAVDFYAQAPLGGDPLPRQRWSFVGGSQTLHTLGTAEFYGDHVAFVDTRYIIPFPERMTILPILGPPRLHLIHAAGMAWVEGDDRRLHHEVGLLLDLSLVHVRAAVVPDDPGQWDFSVSLASPFGRTFPWEQ